jgi:hypothetical protein
VKRILVILVKQYTPEHVFDCVLFLRMPVNTRDRTVLGRFPGVTLEPVEEVEEEVEEDQVEQGGCCRWMRQVCPGLFRQPEMDDITDTEMTGVDEEEKPDGGGGPKPHGGDQHDGSSTFTLGLTELISGTRQGVKGLMQYDRSAKYRILDRGF